MTRPTFPVPVETTPEDEAIYLGISRQDLDFHQSLCELIDNAVSGKHDDDRFMIEILIERNGEDISLDVIDDGIGISISDIKSKVMKIGGRGSNPGLLNEHGFGLKNSLCVLTGNQREFALITRDEEALERNLIYMVRGPFRLDMEIVEATEEDFNENIAHCRTDGTGTRVKAKTTLQYFKSLYPSGRRFGTIVDRLPEHLGVLYRGYLRDERNEIWLRYRDLSEGETVWTEQKVKAINIPYIDSERKTFRIMHDGSAYKVIYERGELDKSQVEDGSLGSPYPLQIYYKQNLRTQGIDINVRGRVILPHQIEYLWPDKDRHNSHNKFVGELTLGDPIFSTVNNKTGLDPINPVWGKLHEQLQRSEYRPIEFGGVSLNEREIRNRLLERLPNIVPDSTARDDSTTWSGLGVKIDILHRYPSDEEHIYELKAGRAMPQDVYQLVMYWDDRVEDNARPALGRLVASEANPNILDLIEYWNSREDKGGERYNLEFKKVDDLIEAPQRRQRR